MSKKQYLVAFGGISILQFSLAVVYVNRGGYASGAIMGEILILTNAVLNKSCFANFPLSCTVNFVVGWDGPAQWDHELLFAKFH